MANTKNKPTNEEITGFLDKIDDAQKRQDCTVLIEMMQEITQEQPKLWASSMMGFGTRHYKYESGHEGDTFVVGFSPRKQNLTLYGLTGLDEQPGLIEKLGKHTTGKGCLYIKRLADVHLPTLQKLIQHSVKHWANL
jgi:Domain of unknown function (DU1801)